jgi:uncharacterized protein YggE
LGEVGAVLDAAVESGVNQRASISFSSNDADKLVRQARIAAVAEARMKARELVEGAGAGLGMVRSISEGSNSPWRVHQFDMPARAELGHRQLPIAAGEQEISVSVTLTYDLAHVSK